LDVVHFKKFSSRRSKELVPFLFFQRPSLKNHTLVLNHIQAAKPKVTVGWKFFIGFVKSARRPLGANHGGAISSIPFLGS
jgi:hypothetical protein